MFKYGLLAFFIWVTPLQAQIRPEFYPDAHARSHMFIGTVSYLVLEATLGHPWSYLLPTVGIPLTAEIVQHTHNGPSRIHDAVQDFIDFQIVWVLETRHGHAIWVVIATAIVYYGLWVIVRECEPWLQKCK